MKITILGGGPAGLYCGLLLKKANPMHDVTIVERNAADATYGWGVVFSDRTLAAFQEADPKSYRAITESFVLWDAIDVRYKGELVRCGGHVFAGLARKELLAILQRRCREVGVAMRFNAEVTDLAALGAYDVLIAADGVNSLLRNTYAGVFQPRLVPGRARYVWLGTDKVFDSFTFIFRENGDGLFQVHAYPFSGQLGTFIVECDEATWRRAGLENATEAESIAYCERLFTEDLGDARLLPNNSKWISFVTVKCATWRHGNVVLLGDAAHTAHFSIGSGTKLAMEDAIALANAVELHADLDTALTEYELERRPVVETLQAAAAESQSYFENVKRSLALAPIPFTFNLMTRSGRITYDDLRLRDTRFGERVDRWFARGARASRRKPALDVLAPPPLFAPLRLRDVRLANRAVLAPDATPAVNGLPTLETFLAVCRLAEDGAGMVLSSQLAISPEARITPEDAGLYGEAHARAWKRVADYLHARTHARLMLQLSHAGRRGATRPRREGLDRPLRDGGWPLVSASAIPYTARSQTSCELDRAGMDPVRDDFVRAARLAHAAGCDVLLLHMGHGYLLASFLSPLSNRRADEYGGSLEGRMRFPLDVFDAVRAAWPAEKPLAVALTVTDAAPGGLTIEDGVAIARALKDHGCDLVLPLAGQTVPDTDIAYRRGFLTPLCERVRNEAGIATLAGGYLATTNDANTILAGGRADLCLLAPIQRQECASYLGASLYLEHAEESATDERTVPNGQQNRAKRRTGRVGASGGRPPAAPRKSAPFAKGE
jgi:anthraniloyl-CoA monooxygenase